MQFSKYSSIENSYREKYINYIIESGYSNEEYVVTSKVDGANFSFICNGKNIIYASRNEKVGTDFFNCQIVANKYNESIQQLFDLINTESAIEQLQVYGELVGDGINNRVKYCRDRDFIVFDIFVIYKFPVIKNTKQVYLNYDKLKYFVSQTNLVLAPEHYRGNLQQCLDYCTNNITFKSLIPNLLNNEYKNLEINNEEGYVIRPIKYLKLNSGDRVIIKCKSPTFKETGNKDKPPAKVIELTEEENTVLEQLTELITESRVYSVTSKLGVLTANDFGKVLGLYIKDVIEEFNKDNKVQISRQVNKQLNKLCSNCIRGVWLNVLN